MKLRPILFSTAMVQAILEGRKTQTRRVVKPQPMKDSAAPHKDGNQWLHMGSVYKCPYGQPGDILWVRETWALPQDLDGNDIGYQYKTEYGDGSEDWNWKPSIHMPFAAARIFLRIKSVRVERLQGITEEDAIDEGVETKLYGSHPYFCTLDYTRRPKKQGGFWPGFCADTGDQFRKSFHTLWQSINGAESWNANPWVWVVEFERIRREEAGL